MSDLSASDPFLLADPNRTPFVSPRMVRRFLGMVFFFVAIGLWIAPGTSGTAEVLLLKTGLTSVLCFCTIVALL